MDGSKSGTPGPSFEVLTPVSFDRGESMPKFCVWHNIWVSSVCGGDLFLFVI